MAHLYWSLNFTTLTDPLSRVVVAEVEMYADSNLVDLCVGGTASATTFLEFYPASKAFNGFTNDYWLSDSPTNELPQRLIYEFTSAVDVTRYTLWVSASVNERMTGWTLDYSDDGTTWTTAATVSGFSFPQGEGTNGVGMFTTPGVPLAVTQLTQDNTVTTADFTQIHLLSASELTSTPEVTPVFVPIVQSLSVTELIQSAIVTPVFVPIVQSLSVTELTQSAIVTPEVVGWQVHNLSAIALTQESAVTQALTYPIHVITVNDLVQNSQITAVSFTQVHAIGAYSLDSDNWIKVLDDNYLGYSYSTENKSITNYSNFNFTGSCVFNDKTLLINDTGLFEYGGESDNGMAIVASMKTGKMNGIMGKNGVYPSNKLKRIPDAKVVIDCDKSGGEVTVNVTADENTHLSYANAISHIGFATHRVPIGRGIKFNYVQLEVVGTGCTHLDISSIEYNPVENVRRER